IRRARSCGDSRRGMIGLSPLRILIWACQTQVATGLENSPEDACSRYSNLADPRAVFTWKKCTSSRDPLGVLRQYNTSRFSAENPRESRLRHLNADATWVPISAASRETHGRTLPSIVRAAGARMRGLGIA